MAEQRQRHTGTNQRHYVRRYILDDQRGTCAICELPATWNDRPSVFVLDHIDGAADNNHRGNLRLICPNCDSQLSTYQSRNMGKGRHWRRERYSSGQSY